jgi:lysophospholipase L1-like esterase
MPILEDPRVWEEEIGTLEAAHPAGPDTWRRTVFTGSSSIRLWSTLESDFAPAAVLNHGFGGAELDAVVHYAPRLVVAYRPSVVVLYGGENDLEAFRGKTPEMVLEDVARFAALVEGPDCRLVLHSIKRSPARVSDREAVEECNEGLRAFAEAGGREFVDLAAALSSADGSSRRECFLDDGLHLSPIGYAAWTAALRPLLLP